MTIPFLEWGMHPEMPLVVTLAAALGLALLLGFVAARLKLPALVGYLAAGVMIGPHTPGFVGDVSLAQQLAEIGVMLLMFGVGLHFSVKDLMAVKSIAVPGAVVQMGVATALGTVLAWSWGWSWTSALVLGLSLSVASTVVLLRALESRAALQTQSGRIAVGWLVVEDLAMVAVLVLLPVVAGWTQAPAGASVSGWAALGKTVLAVGGFLVAMLLLGRRWLPWLLGHISATGSRELFTLCVMAVAVSIAYGASLVFGVSVALGAFFAGLVLRESEFSHRAAQDSLPFRDAFAVLFFVAVGMLFDPQVLLDRPGQVLGVTLIIMLGKSVAAALLVLAWRYPLRSALTISAALAQIGEFSFILMALADAWKLVPPEAMSLVVAGALLSMAFNPLLFSWIEPLRQWCLSRSAWLRRLEARHEPPAVLPAGTSEPHGTGHVVLVAADETSLRLTEQLGDCGVSLVRIGRDRATVDGWRSQGHAAVWGDPLDAQTLVQAQVNQAAVLVLVDASPGSARPLIDLARQLQPALRLVALAQTRADAQWLEAVGVDVVIECPQVQAQALAQAVLAQRPAVSPGPSH